MIPETGMKQVIKLYTCALTTTCLNRSNPFPKITDSPTGFAVISVKWPMKDRELPTRLSSNIYVDRGITP